MPTKALPLTRVILYVKDTAKVAAFYERYFGLRRLPGATEKWLELAGPDGGCTIALHSATRTQKSGAAMKIVFGVADVDGFRQAAERDGLKFGVVHSIEGVEFSNTKDPAGNSVQISDRGIQTHP